MPQSILLCVSHLRPVIPSERCPRVGRSRRFQVLTIVFFSFCLPTVNQQLYSAVMAAWQLFRLIGPISSLAIGHLKIIHLTQSPAARSLSASIKAVPFPRLSDR